MEPLIRNYRSVYQPGGETARLVTLADNPPTCTLNYSVIEPGKTSAHHIHPWEHEVFILEGSGVLVCDGKEYPVTQGDAVLIPGNVDHYTRNHRRTGVIRRIEANPLAASRSGGTGNAGTPRNTGSQGTGQPPVIRNLSQIDQSDGPARRLIDTADGAANYLMAFRSLSPGSVAPQHAHPGEHLAYILEGSCTLVVDGKPFTVREGDVALVPPNASHEWRSDSPRQAKWLVFNPL
ncbi:MAG: cupin domain-containing protein [Dehalococcoidia bacterium]|nr:cupin domain-containing protein [Dehalococcoidia bacterium]MSQ17304.1 cupin domain-containing protein [Dehalococcoidia bacterium]